MTQTSDSTRQAPGMDLDALDALDARLYDAQALLTRVRNELRKVKDEQRRTVLRGTPVTLVLNKVEPRPEPCTRCPRTERLDEPYVPMNAGTDDDVAHMYGGAVCLACVQRDDPLVFDLFTRVHNAWLTWQQHHPNPYEWFAFDQLTHAVDQALPDGDGYQRTEFTRAELPDLVAAVERAAGGVVT